MTDFHFGDRVKHKRNGIVGVVVETHGKGACWVDWVPDDPIERQKVRGALRTDPTNLELHSKVAIKPTDRMWRGEDLLRQTLAAIDTGRSEPLFIMRDAIRNYLDRDSDGSPKGGDACGSVHDSARPQDIAPGDAS